MTKEILIEDIKKLMERGEFDENKANNSFSVKDEKGNYVQVTAEKNGNELICTTGKIFKKRFNIALEELQ